MQRRPVQLLLLLLSGSALLGCTEVQQAPVPPVADAGIGQIVRVGARATLDGSGSRLSDGSPADSHLEWSLVARPETSAAELSNVGAVQPWFEVDAVGDFIFRLVVAEDDLVSAPSIVVVRGYVPLEVVAQTPPDGAVEVASTAPVVIAFSEPVQPETVTPETVYVRSGPELVSGFVEIFGGNTLVAFTPFTGYPEGATATVVVTQHVVAVSGVSLPAAYQGHFDVADVADTRVPAIASVEPADQAVDVSENTSVTLVFDEPIDPATIVVDGDGDDCADNFFLTHTATSECVAATVVTTAVDTRVLLTPMAVLATGATYEVTVQGGAGGVTDVAGNAMAGVFSSQFTVTSQSDPQPLTIEGVYPGSSVRGVPIGASIVLTFTKPVLPSSINDQSVAVVRGTTPAVGTIELSMGNTVVTLSPDNLLQPNTEYNIVARGTGATAILDIGGTPLDGDGDGVAGGEYLSSFVTTDEPSFNGVLSLPTVVVPGDPIPISLSDRDGDTSVSRDELALVAASGTGEREALVLTETGGRTGVFEGSVNTLFAAAVGTNDDGTFNVQVGDTITFTYLDEVSAAGGQRYEVGVVLVSESVAGVIVSAISGDTTEGGGTATFAINLASEPTADVVVSFDSSDPGEGTVTPTSMTFTTLNFSSPQIATVRGVDDTVADGDIAYQIVFDPTSSSDGAYDGLTPAAIDLQNLDDDTTGIDVSAISGPTGEWGGTATFTVVLESQPSADVVLTFDTDTASEGTVNPTSLTFTDADWDQEQTVTVTGQDDDIADGNASYLIVFDPTTSADAAFDNLSLPSVSVSNLDDDFAGFDVVPAGGLTTTENDGTGVFQLRLTSEPLDDVTVNFDSDTLTEGTVSTTSLVFTSSTWNDYQTVTVTGVDDSVQDGDQAYLIDFSATTSTDGTYGALEPTDVTVTNLEVGSEPSVTIVQPDVEPGAGILIRVDGETDEYGNLTAGADNDVLTVTVSSSTDSETMDLAESATVAGDFDCTVDACLLATALDTGSATNDDGVLEVGDGDTITLTYDDMMRADGTSTGVAVTDTATATVTAVCLDLSINEIVTTPQSDWDNSTGGGDGSPFTSSPGTGAAATDGTDQWVELYNGCGGAVDLEAGDGYKLVLDAAPDVYDFDNDPGVRGEVVLSSGTVAAFPAGGYLVLGEPGFSAVSDDVWIRLELPDNRGVIDQVAIGSSPGGDGDGTNNTVPSGAGSTAADEAVARSTDGGAWAAARTTARIGSAN